VAVCGAGLLACLARINKMAEDLAGVRAEVGAMKERLDWMIESKMEQAKREFLIKNLGEMNSPTQLYKRTKDQFDRHPDLVREIKQWWLGEGIFIEDEEKLVMALGQKFRADLTEKICVPLGLINDSCVIAALGIARNVPVINMPHAKSVKA
jgi:hypothetical protein